MRTAVGLALLLAFGGCGDNTAASGGSGGSAGNGGSGGSSGSGGSAGTGGSGGSMPDGSTVDGPPPPPSQQLDPDISGMVGNVSAANITNSLMHLVGFYTRNACSDQTSSTMGIGAARDWINGQFGGIGNGVHTMFDNFSETQCTVTTQKNVLAWFPGTHPTRIIVVGGHYDSRGDHTVANNGTEAAPGANDSGSQTAMLLEAARVMSGHTYDATIIFASFSGEEQGLYGSINLAMGYGQYTDFAGGHIEAMLDADIIGGDVDANNPTNYPGALQQFRLYSPGTPREVTGTAGQSETGISGVTDDTSPSRGILRHIGYWGTGYVPNMLILPHLREDRPGRGGDHEPFLDQGIPGVRFIETNENFARQHTADDTVANMTPAYNARITQVIVASAASLARAPQAPQSATASGNASSAMLSWQAPAIGTVDHYVIAARPVGENFYHTRVTTTSLSKTVTPADLGVTGAYFVSVAAVDAAGHESLFAYPEYRCDDTGCSVQAGSTNVTQRCATTSCLP